MGVKCKENINEIWIMKGIAIISVVSAHVSYDTSSNTIEQGMLSLLNIFGTVGVVLFFFLSGYLFYGNNENLATFWMKKVIRLGVPWLICGTLVYLHCFQLYNFHNWATWYDENIAIFVPKDYIKYLIGYNSLYYYMTMLFCCFFVYQLARKKPMLFIVITLILVILQQFSVGNMFFPTPYLNPISWLGYFGLGCCCNLLKSRFNSLEKLCNMNICVFGVLILDLLLFLAMVWFGVDMNYWHGFFFPFVMTQVVACYVLSKWLAKNTRILSLGFVRLGRDSFYIYLLHMLLQSIPIKYLKRFGAIGVLLRPFFLILIFEIMLYIVRHIYRFVFAQRT